MRKFLSPFPCFLLGCLCWAIGFSTACSNGASSVEEVTVGGIAGSVSDQTTGEPVATVNVTLSPGGRSTVTGSDGSFSFVDLAQGAYTIDIHKEGYNPNSKTVEVVASQQTSAHLLIERIPAIITADHDELDFGENDGINTLSFGIVNSSYEDLSWQIEHDCKWIKEIRPTRGVLKLGKTETIVVIIDRELLAAGNNETVIVVRSTNGRAEVKIKAIGTARCTPRLNTLDVTDVAASSVTLHGEILDAGIPAYTERGFVYSLNSMPTFENMLAKLTSPVTEDNIYSYNLRDLTLGKTYHVRAYATNSVGTAYSANEIDFTTVSSQPKVSVNEVSNIDVTKGSATFKGTIEDAGDPAYFERGFVYGMIHNPTLEETKVIVNGTGIGEFSADITGLQLDKKYYLRAYATCKIGETEQTVYSDNEIQFTLSTTAPVVSTQAVTDLNISAGSATFNGTVDSVGEPAYTERGFVYGLTSNPTVNDTKIVVNGTGAGAFSTGVSDLQLNQKYYVRAYAINATQTAYSADNITFTLTSTAPVVSVQDVSNLNVSAGTVTLNGSVVNAGDPAYIERGFVYGLTGNPTVSDTKVTVSGTGTGTYSAVIRDLQLDQKYYVRAYANSKIGDNVRTTYSSEQVSFTYAATKAQVSIQAAEDVDVETGEASLYGSIVSVGDPAYTECGFVYAQWDNPTLDDSEKAIVTKSGTGVFRTHITGIPLEKIYYVRAYATNLAGTAYSSEITVSTKATLPQVETLEAADVDISTGSATLRGNIVNAGSPAYSECGFVYSTIATAPTINDNKIVGNASGTIGSFSVYTTKLPANKTIYIRAYATNRGGTVYGKTTVLEPEWIELPEANIAVQKKDIGYGYWDSVNAMCENSVVAGKTDWRLPTKDELMVLYNERNYIGGFTTTYCNNPKYHCYWSSTKYSSDYYYYIRFDNGTIDNSYYHNIYYYSGRCVRTLNPTTTTKQ